MPFPYSIGQTFWLDTPRTDSSLWKVTGDLVNLQVNTGGILLCHYPLG